MALIYFLIASALDVLRYHPVFEYVGAHRLKMGEISRKFLREMKEKGNSSAVDIEKIITQGEAEVIELGKISHSSIPDDVDARPVATSIQKVVIN